MSSLQTLPLPAPAEPRSETGAAGRIAVLLYGAAVYAFFLPTFLYAIGFVTGIAVPKTIDDGVVAPLSTALLVNAALLGLFAVQHLIMARPAFKRRWTRIVPVAAERSTFVLFTCLILCAMYWQWRPMTGVVWDVGSGALATTLTALSLAGWGIVLLATFLIDHFDLFGLKQVINHARRKPHVQPKFMVKGLYRRVRHPLYLGFFIAFWATPTMTVGHLFFCIMTTGFVLVAVRFEERDLKNAHPEYGEYADTVPMILPSPGRSFRAVRQTYPL